MELTKTLTLYMLDDCTFVLSDTDERCNRTLDEFGKFQYSVKQDELFYVLEEYYREHGLPYIILSIWARYYRVEGVTTPVEGVTTPVCQLLYRYDYGARPLEKIITADERQISFDRDFAENIIFRSTYWDNVAFMVHVDENIKTRDTKKVQARLGNKKESIVLVERNHKQVRKQWQDIIKTAEANSNDTWMLKGEQLAATDMDLRTLAYKRVFRKNVQITEKESSTTGKQKQESLAIEERPIKAVYLNPWEIVLVIDNTTAYFRWFRAISEKISVIDTAIKDATHTAFGAVSITDGQHKELNSFLNEIASVEDGESKHNGKASYGYIGISDGTVKDTTAVREDALKVIDSPAKKIQRAFRETVTAISAYMSHAKPLYSDAVQLTDDENKALHAVYKEMLHYTEIYWDNVAFLVHVTENVNLSDAIRKTAEKQLYDAVSFMDFLRNKAGLYKTDPFNVTDEDRKKMEHTLFDSISVLDEWRADMRLLLQEQVSNMEALVRHITARRKDDVQILELLKKSNQRPLGEQLALSDALTNTTGINKQEAVTMDDWMVKHAASVQNEKIVIKDFWNRVWNTLQVFREQLKTLDKIHRDVYAVQDDRIRVIDNKLIGIQKSIAKERVTMGESFNRAASWIKHFEELAQIGEFLTKKTGKNAAEDIGLYDSFVRASNAYIEAVQLTKEIKDELGFYKMSDTPPLYEMFTPFHVGDYEYQKAMLRLRLVSNSAQAQPLIYDVAAHIDIDDTDDRGQIEITDKEAPTKVYYNRHYYNAPEVQVVVRGGNSDLSVVPHIITTDGKDEKGRYFEIELQDPSGNRTTGRISWVSKGW